jgi:integral membrane protein (TIGR01906 family)
MKILIIVLIPLLLVLGSVRLLVTDQFLAYEYSKGSFPSDPFGFDRSQRIEYAGSNFRFVRENKPIEFLADQRLGEAPLYNSRELKHMQDVQDVYQVAWRVLQLSLGLFALAILFFIRRRETWPELGKALITGGLLTTGLIAVIGLLAVVAWQTWFIIFHQIFFEVGTWSFELSDTLIRLFPEKFWFDSALTISGISLAGGLAFALTGKILKRGSKGQSLIPNRSN